MKNNSPSTAFGGGVFCLTDFVVLSLFVCLLVFQKKLSVADNKMNTDLISLCYEKSPRHIENAK